MQTVLLVGAGRMGSAMLRGWCQRLGHEYHLVVVDRHAEHRFSDILPRPACGPQLSFVEHVEQLTPEVKPDAVVLAVKPQDVMASIRTIKGKIAIETVLVSVAAGFPLLGIKAVSPGPAVRVMPNIGAMVGHSVSAGFACSGTTHRQKKIVNRLFAAIGQMVWLDKEEDLHLATAISGSGPAYYFAFCEAMIAAAIEEGLSPEVAQELAIGTVVSAGHLLAKTPDPLALRESVTSPLGTTAAGLAALTSENRLFELSRAAISGAAKRSVELSAL